MITAYIGLGSNLLDPLGQLRRAVQAIAALPQSQLRRVSTAYRSAAIGPGKQPDYLNAVLQLDTDLEAQQLLAALQAMERDQGRVRTVRWGPRSLDLDILLYGNARIDSPTLSVPHPRLRDRSFVLYPLAAIADPQLLLPDGEDLDTLIARCPRTGLVDTGLRLTD